MAVWQVVLFVVVELLLDDVEVRPMSSATNSRSLREDALAAEVVVRVTPVLAHRRPGDGLPEPLEVSSASDGPQQVGVRLEPAVRRDGLPSDIDKGRDSRPHRAEH